MMQKCRSGLAMRSAGNRRRFAAGAREQVAALLAHLRVEPCADADSFTGTSVDLGWGRVYGGQTMAQALDAAHQTCGGRVVHSFTAYFYRPGRTDAPMDFRVARLSDGRNLSCRSVTASQGGEAVFSALVSCAAAPDGAARVLEHERPITGGLGAWDPAGAPRLRDLVRPYADVMPAPLKDLYLNEAAPLELRHENYRSPVDGAASEPDTTSYIRVAAPMPADARAHATLLAYASDWGMLSTALRPHEGVRFFDKNVRLATISHSMTFHRPDDLRLDENYVGVRVLAPSAARGRGFVQSEFFAEGGALLASASQEGVLRIT